MSLMWELVKNAQYDYEMPGGASTSTMGGRTMFSDAPGMTKATPSGIPQSTLRRFGRSAGKWGRRAGIAGAVAGATGLAANYLLDKAAPEQFQVSQADRDAQLADPAIVAKKPQPQKQVDSGFDAGRLWGDISGGVKDWWKSLPTAGKWGAGLAGGGAAAYLLYKLLKGRDED